MSKRKRKAEPGKAAADLWVFLRRDSKGGWRRYWYGRFQRAGKKRETSLCPWQGTPPEDPTRQAGNDAFEQSRERARRLLADIVADWEGADDELHDAIKIYSLRYNRRVDRVKLAELAERWDALPNKGDVTEERRERVHSVLKRFVDFMGDHFPGVTETGALLPAHFASFFGDLDKSGVTARTWNDYLTILRGTLAATDARSKGFREWLLPQKKRQETPIHRRPFSFEELAEIFEAARVIDPELRPVLIAATWTALRRKDVCLLKWASVDMARGYITGMTFKTGKPYEIPISRPLMVELEEAERKRRPGVPYVFPGVAIAYQRNPDSLNVRLQAVLARAGFIRPELPTAKKGKRDNPNAGKFPAPASSSDALERVEAGMRVKRWREAQRKRGLAILERHLAGKLGKEIAEELEIGAATVSEYLHEMETAGEVALVSPPKVEEGKATLAAIGEEEQRKQRGSLCGWHSFKTSFVSLALQNGMKIETLRRITGNATSEVLLRHYDQRGRDQLRKEFDAVWPAAIVGAGGDGEELAEDTATTTRKAPAAKRKEPVEVVEAVPGDVAALARELLAADPAKLAKVREMLAAGEIG